MKKKKWGDGEVADRGKREGKKGQKRSDEGKERRRGETEKGGIAEKP